MGTVREIIDVEINRLERVIQIHYDDFESWHKEIEEEGYAIAGDFFGHGDDCFEKGTEYGEGLEAINTLEFLKELREKLVC